MISKPTGFRPIVDKIDGLKNAEENGSILQINYGYETDWKLVVEYGFHAENSLWFIFDDVLSYRVQDEGCILGYWERRDEENAPRTAVYSIESSPYLSEFLENYHAEIRHSHGRPLMHLFFTGQDACLEVITSAYPVVVYKKPAIKIL